MSQFIYLLNALEATAQSENPFERGYADKRRAVLEYVEKLEALRPEVVASEEARLRAIIRQAIWDIGCERADMALVCLRYAGVEEAPLPERPTMNNGEPK